jgi:NTE family protein
MQHERASESKDLRVLVLQGGGALGAYQAGAYEALAEHGYAPDWIAGISIGAINGAIIAGNAPEDRVPRLRQFWNMVSSALKGIPISHHNHWRNSFNEASSLFSLIYGVPGFFEPRFPSPVFAPTGTIETLGYYSTVPLQETLRNLVNFELLKRKDIRLSVGAVNLKSGNFAYFDNHKLVLTPQHIMASGALPPGLPPVKIDNDYYWDGGLVSNTPLQFVLDEPTDASALCIFQIDLFSARGTLPENLLDAVEREKEIRYSSRTRFNTDMMRQKMAMRKALKRLLKRLPPELKDDPDVQLLAQQKDDPDISIMHLIYRARAYESHARDYEFSRVSVEEHWEQGQKDVKTSLAHATWRGRPDKGFGFRVFDLTQKLAAE